MRLQDIEGVGEAYAAKLGAVGIGTVGALLEVCALPRARATVAERTGISEKQILEWANHADLMRIDGVGSEYADLLEEAGVDTVPELAHRSAANLHEKLKAVNGARGLVRRLLSVKLLEGWIAEAKVLPRILTY